MLHIRVHMPRIRVITFDIGAFINRMKVTKLLYRVTILLYRVIMYHLKIHITPYKIS